MQLSIVIVCYGEDLSRLLAEVGAQRAAGDEVIVVDNKASAGGTDGFAVTPRSTASSTVPATWGSPRRSISARGRATRDVLLLLNPDAIPAPGCFDALRRPPASYAAWMGVVTLPGGDRVNTAGGESHYLGFSWVGGLDEPVSELPRDPYHAGFISGACLAVRLDVWREMGGFPSRTTSSSISTMSTSRIAYGCQAGTSASSRPPASSMTTSSTSGLRKWRNLEAATGGRR